jgi:hypothetical protein
VSKILVGKYQATIYREGDGFTGAISLGFDARGNRHRIKRKGRTKAGVKDKLIEAVNDLETGIQATESYTVADAVRDWLAKGIKTSAQVPSTATASSLTSTLSRRSARPSSRD